MSTEVNETTPSAEEIEPVLQFKELDVSFRTEFGRVQAVKGVSLVVNGSVVKPGEVVALVGESGSGKSVTATTALGLLPKTARITGETMVADKAISKLAPRQLRGLRGNRVAMVFQEPMTALNPVIKIGEQLTESMEVHNVAHGEVAWQKAIDLLKAVGIPNAERRVKQYPHELSGGMRQRVVIAMALACDPEVIIADEPTTALDVTVQADILDLLRSLKEKLNTGILLITHNMGVVADMADRVAVMFKGNIVERGTAEEVLLNPQHPYTKKLLDAVPHLGAGHGQFGSVPSDVAENATSALEVNDLVVEYKRTGKRPFRAVDGVTFDVKRGEIVGLVGESGCGKSISSMAVMGLLPPSARISGEILFKGRNILEMTPAEHNALRGHEMSMVYQDALSSLNPSMLIRTQMAQLTSRGGTRSAEELLELVGLDPKRTLRSYPHELSGGQRQRVLIAMALTRDPSLVICDEPTTALDVTVQKQVIRLLNDLQAKLGFAMIFVSHDLALVAEVASEITVMYAGQVIEQAPTKELLTNPIHEYTRGLLGSVLSIEEGAKTGTRLHQVPGSVPSPEDFPAGDRFAPRSSHPTLGLDVHPVLKRLPGDVCHRFSELPDDYLKDNGLTPYLETLKEAK